MKPYDSRIILCKVDLDISSGHTIFFKDINEQLDYFSRDSYEIANQYYIRQSGRYKLDKPIADVNARYNYIIFINPSYEDKYYFANILDYTYTNDSITSIEYVIDDLQTYMFDINLSKTSYVTRRHIHASERDVIADLPLENIDTGRDYQTVLLDYINLNSNNNIYMLIMSESFKTADRDGFSVASSSKGFYTYDDNGNIHVLSSASDIYEGLTVYFCDYTAYKQFMSTDINNPLFVNKCQGAMILPFSIAFFGSGEYITYSYQSITGINESGTFYHFLNSALYKDYDISISKQLDSYIKKALFMPTNTSAKPILVDVLKKQPYTMVDVMDSYGNIKQYDYFNVISDGNIKISLSGVLGLVPTFAYTVEEPRRHGFNNSISGMKPLHSITNLNKSYMYIGTKLSFVHKYMSAYLQANQSQLDLNKIHVSESYENTVNNINIQGLMSESGNKLSLSNTQLQQQTSILNQQIQVQTANNNQVVSNVMSGLGVVSNIAMGNVGGVLSGGAGMIASNINHSNNINASSQIFANQISTSQEIANANYQHSSEVLAQNKAMQLRNTSLQNKQTIDSLNAKMQDMNNIPNTINFVTNTSLYKEMFNLCLIEIGVKSLMRENMIRVANYFSMYGYRVNFRESIQSVINMFENGVYIQTADTNIGGNVPQNAINRIRTQFENGLFIWKKPEMYRESTRLMYE